MPIYEYRCAGCGHCFETLQGFEERALSSCPVCTEPKLEKLISSPPAFRLKGTGWYATDFKDKPKNPVAETNEGGEQSSQQETVTESKGEGSK